VAIEWLPLANDHPISVHADAELADVIAGEQHADADRTQVCESCVNLSLKHHAFVLSEIDHHDNLLFYT